MKKWWVLLDNERVADGIYENKEKALSAKGFYEENNDAKRYAPYELVQVIEVTENYEKMVDLANLGSIVKSLVKILGEK